MTPSVHVVQATAVRSQCHPRYKTCHGFVLLIPYQLTIQPLASIINPIKPISLLLHQTTHLVAPIILYPLRNLLSPYYIATMPPTHLNFITGNANKLKEVQSILATTSVELRSQNLDLPELQGTIEEITRDKCLRAAEIVGGSSLT